MSLNHPTGQGLAPADIAEALTRSIRNDHAPRRLDPTVRADLLDVARWSRGLGLEADARAALETPREVVRLTEDQLVDYLRTEVSPHPARWAEVAEAAKTLETWRLAHDVERLRACGTPWGRVTRLFWKDRDGRERVRTLGLACCKDQWCPHHGRRTQKRRAGEIERCLELAREWGFSESHVRFLTLTIENGGSLPALRERAHGAWAKLQRTRWWPRHVFGWFRGTEVVTGKDGQWNLHLHVVVVLWSRWVSYRELGRVWTHEAGGRQDGSGLNLVVDVDTLQSVRQGAKGKGLSRAAHYVVKYLTKSEELTKLRNGPGGLAHVRSSTRGLRRFAVGGGCSVLRRLLDILLPSWALRAEQALADAHLVDQRPPWRAEEVDPQTGEVRDIPPPAPFSEGERERLVAIARPLMETGRAGVGVPAGAGAHRVGITVGTPCGPRYRYRRMGPLPLQSRPLTVAEVEARTQDQGPVAQVGVRRLVAGGSWKVSRWEEEVPVYRREGKNRIKTDQTRTIKRAAVLPARRYAWRPIALAVRLALQEDPTGWRQRRHEAAGGDYQARVAAGGTLGQGLTRMDLGRAVAAAADDRVVVGRRRSGAPIVTTERRKKARDLQDTLLGWINENPELYLARRDAIHDAVGQLLKPSIWAVPPRPTPEPITSEPTFLEGFL